MDVRVARESSPMRIEASLQGNLRRRMGSNGVLNLAQLRRNESAVTQDTGRYVDNSLHYF